MIILLKRAYESPKPEDGFRVLVDRLWPRGVSKEDAAIDLWDKEITPSTPLRKWFAHDKNKWLEFKARYQKELDQNPTAVSAFIYHLQHKEVVTFVYGAKDTQYTHARILKAYVEEKLKTDFTLPHHTL
ncbi:DUF488 domain-containing protein [Sulfurospirillum sp. 1612]|uniref:DUF488 domain-containing protein n=1 Tax=Sulfurospirillum sp. 1612 TaxID=3094835 RepID=UPI002F92E3F7